jgi:hypothetical protein
VQLYDLACFYDNPTARASKWLRIGPAGQVMGKHDTPVPHMCSVHVWSISQEIFAFSLLSLFNGLRFLCREVPKSGPRTQKEQQLCTGLPFGTRFLAWKPCFVQVLKRMQRTQTGTLYDFRHLSCMCLPIEQCLVTHIFNKASLPSSTMVLVPHQQSVVSPHLQCLLCLCQQGFEVAGSVRDTFYVTPSFLFRD